MYNFNFVYNFNSKIHNNEAQIKIISRKSKFEKIMKKTFIKSKQNKIKV